MIFDADVHIMPDKSEGNTINAEQLIDNMDKNGVDKSLIWLQPPYMRHIDKANEYIYKSMKKYHNRLYGFGWVDPHLGYQHAVDTIKRCVDEYGFYGIKMNGAQNSYFIDDPNLALPIVEEIARTGKILAFHCGADEYQFTHPYRIGKIASMYPETKIFMVHMGGASFKDLAESAMEVAAKHDNIHLIGSAVKSKKILKAVRYLGARRLSFGSDTPFEYTRVALASYNALLDGHVSDLDKTLIMGENMKILLNL